MLSAQARPHQHHHTPTARGSKRCRRRDRHSWRVARALFAPWRNDRPFTEHARLACCADSAWLCADAGRAPPNAVDRGSTVEPSRQDGDTAVNLLWPPRPSPVARSPRAFRSVEYRPTAHETCVPCSADLVWLCCRPTRGALLPTLSAEARPRHHHDRSAARRSNSLWPSCSSPVARSPRAFQPVEY